jgi:hypothetical protein
MLHKILPLITGAAIFFAIGCSTSPDIGTGSLEVRLFDEPGDFKQVNIKVDSVQINRTQNEEAGWETISEPNQTYNMLELINGNFEVLADTELEVGMVRQIRLILNRNDNTVVVEGEDEEDETHSLSIPGGQETGVKINIDAEITEGIRYVLNLDFNVDRSVVKTGQASNPGYILQPVIRASNEALTGNIGGTVLPVEANTSITAYGGEEEIATTTDPDTGGFLLIGLDNDVSYSVVIESAGYETIEFEDVDVTIGETNDLGEIVLTPEGE